MSDSGMPWAVLNMGSEMLYILEQRLQAQNIADDKASRVLQDVVTTMFSDQFLGELFKPQRMYSAAATRQLFDQLAHSSIMRLNTASMDKLYDLMAMAAKHQLLLAPSPFDLPQIAYNHIDTLKKMHLSAESKKLIDAAATQLHVLYATYTYTDYFALRQSLARFYQEKRVKVSLFLQEGLQLADGNIACSAQGALPVNTDLPGRVVYYEDGKEVRSEALKLANASGVKERSASEKTELGLNLYAKDKRKKARAAALAGTSAANSNSAARRLDKGKEEYDGLLDEEDKAAAKGELSALAKLIGGGSGGGAGEKDKLSIDQLFPGLKGDGGADGADDGVLVFDAEDAQGLEKRMAALECKDQSGQDDDLLDLMDKA